MNADAAGTLWRLLGRERTVFDVRSMGYGVSQRWFVHYACEKRHRPVMDALRSRPSGPVDLVAGMSKREVVSLIGEPIARASTDELLGGQLSVVSLGGGHGNVDLWFFDVLPTPGRVLRIAFGNGKVLGMEEVDWQR